MLEIKINNGPALKWDENTAFTGDLVRTGERSWHLIRDYKTYEIVLLAYDREEKKISLRINNRDYHLSIRDEMDILLEKMGLADAAAKKLNDLKAPMPGLVREIKVSVGQEVEKGDALIVLEAMKMENVLKAPNKATVKSVEVSPGNAVEKNQILLKFA